MLYWRKFFVLCRKVYFWLYLFLSKICEQDGLVGILYCVLFVPSLALCVRPSVQVGFLPVAFWTAAVIAVIIIERPSAFIGSNGTTSHG